MKPEFPRVVVAEFLGYSLMVDLGWLAAKAASGSGLQRGLAVLIVVVNQYWNPSLVPRDSMLVVDCRAGFVELNCLAESLARSVHQGCYRFPLEVDLAKVECSAREATMNSNRSTHWGWPQAVVERAVLVDCHSSNSVSDYYQVY